MTKINLRSKTRDVVGKKVKKQRKTGSIPAVLYGNKIKPQNLWVDFSDFKKAYQEAGESTILELDVDSKSKVNVLIHEVQLDPMSGNFFHIDFFQVRMDEKIETEVPIEFVGESEVVKALGGMLVKNLDAIPISCLPADLPSKFEVDISKLKTFDDVIRIADLGISEKIKVQIDPETVIVNAVEPRSEEELAKLEEKVEADVTKVEGVVKETPEGEVATEEKKE